MTLWAGYTHNPQYAAGDFTMMEHRAREQVTFDGFAGSATEAQRQDRLEHAGGTEWTAPAGAFGPT